MNDGLFAIGFFYVIWSLIVWHRVALLYQLGIFWGVICSFAAVGSIFQAAGSFIEYGLTDEVIWKAAFGFGILGFFWSPFLLKNRRWIFRYAWQKFIGFVFAVIVISSFAVIALAKESVLDNLPYELKIAIVGIGGAVAGFKWLKRRR